MARGTSSRSAAQELRAEHPLPLELSVTRHPWQSPLRARCRPARSSIIGATETRTNMLDQILQKLGLKSIDDLKPAEKATWMQWATILGKKDVTIEDLKKFLPVELERATVELRK